MSPDLAPGVLFGSYRLEERLGGGSFGSVWRATDTSTGAVVAVKVLAGTYSSDEAAQIHADVELLAAAASGSSIHIVRVLGSGSDPSPYLVMEFLDGTDLAAILNVRGRLPERDVLRIADAVADALAALSGVGIIHRDIKPANIMLCSDGGVKLTDFGIAKIAGFDVTTSTGRMPLTMAYAAPEVWDGKATGASDIYALGVVLFQCLSGRLPFIGSYSEVFRGHLSATPEFDLLPQDTTPALRALIEECLAKSPGARPPGPEALLDEIRKARTELGPGADAPIGQPPAAYGPWQVVGPHPTRPWAWAARHDKTGDRAVVEVCFAESAEIGLTLRRAVDVNPALVPLGAERLLGSNRLILRPGEAWPQDPPSGPFAFWVAREELPTPEIAPLDQAALRKLLQSVFALETTAKAAGLGLDLGPTALVPLPDGSVHLRRPGLPPDTTGDPDSVALGTIRGLPLDLALTATVARAPSLAVLGSELRVAGYVAPHVEKTVLVEPSAAVTTPALAPAPAGSPAALSDPAPPRRRRRVLVGLLGGGVILALAAAAAYGSFFAGGSHPTPAATAAVVAVGSTPSAVNSTVASREAPNGSSASGPSSVPVASGGTSSGSTVPTQNTIVGPTSGSSHAPNPTRTPAATAAPATAPPTATPTAAPTPTPTPTPVPTPAPTPSLFTFTGSGVVTVPTGGATMRVLLVGGGGGGGDGGGSAGQGWSGGGGGGGGFIDQTIFVPAGTYNVTVGSGGLRNGNGGNSSFYTLTAKGGGAGGVANGGNGQSGGSGGGGSTDGNAGGGTGGQGTDGGDGDKNTPRTGGGGGGAGSGGMTATVYQGGIGGSGKASNITGASKYYAGGGGGGACSAGAGSGAAGQGGGGVGAGNNGPSAGSGIDATGGGGGGGAGYGSPVNVGASGGSGIVVISSTVGLASSQSSRQLAAVDTPGSRPLLVAPVGPVGPSASTGDRLSEAVTSRRIIPLLVTGI